MSDSTVRDGLLWLMLAAVAVAVGLPAELAGKVGLLLQQSGVLLRPGEGVVSVPHLGSVDVPRLLVGALLLVVVVVVLASFVRRSKSRAADRS